MAVNPYAAPAADDASIEPSVADAGVSPRGAVLVARGYLVLVLSGLFLGGGSALALRLELWTLGIDGPPELYGKLLALHGATMVFAVVLPALYGLLPSVMVPELLRAQRMRTLALAVLAMVLWTCGATVTIAIAATSDGWTYYDPAGTSSRWVGPSLIATGMALQCVHVLALLVSTAGTSAARRLVVLALALPLVWRTAVLAWTVGQLAREPADPVELLDAWAMLGPLHVDVVAALAILGWALARDGATAWRKPAAVLLGAGVLPALVGVAITRVILATGPDEHLLDTTFFVGRYHLIAAMITFAILAGLLSWAQPLFGRAPRRWAARLGSLIVCGGVLGHAIALLVLGARGMPRRYIDYPDVFVGPQQAATAASAMIAVGACVVVLALALGPDERADA